MYTKEELLQMAIDQNIPDVYPNMPFEDLYMTVLGGEREPLAEKSQLNGYDFI